MYYYEQSINKGIKKLKSDLGKTRVKSMKYFGALDEFENILKYLKYFYTWEDKKSFRQFKFSSGNINLFTTGTLLVQGTEEAVLRIESDLNRAMDSGLFAGFDSISSRKKII
ncbi:hypothetical protein [Leptospira stimsonii]|uniref:Uncharacterized protein n=1 Tax=Leptospira stimsonii TaxID=2202203 RepID=A0A8B3CJ83_9LEPT|nr:hypothetical protein [Leptospira stimsonii]RHX83378.1 hypothetical protein DLM78_22020 [Leptospira stimsonii]